MLLKFTNTNAPYITLSKPVNWNVSLHVILPWDQTEQKGYFIFILISRKWDTTLLHTCIHLKKIFLLQTQRMALVVMTTIWLPPLGCQLQSHFGTSSTWHHTFNPLSANGTIYWHWAWSTLCLSDALPPNGARPSTGTMLTSQFHKFHSMFYQCLCVAFWTGWYY